MKIKNETKYSENFILKQGIVIGHYSLSFSYDSFKEILKMPDGKYLTKYSLYKQKGDKDPSYVEYEELSPKLAVDYIEGWTDQEFFPCDYVASIDNEELFEELKKLA